VVESNRGEEMFYCFACDVGARNIIGLYQLHSRKSQRETVKELAKIIGITIKETAYEKGQIKKYQNNKEYLKEDLNTLFPATSKWINRYQRHLYLSFFNREGEESITSEHHQYKGQNVFFASYRYIAKELKKVNMQSVQNTMILLNLLGFIERVPESEIPKRLKERAEEEKQLLRNVFEEQGEKGKRRAKAVRLINFYIVNDWKKQADNIEEKAQMLLDKSFSITTHHNKIAIEKLFGKKTANQIFPDQRIVPTRFDAIAERIKQMINTNIKKDGFAIAEDVIRREIRYRGIKLKLKEKEDILKRAVLLDKEYQVERTWSKKKKEIVGYTRRKPKTIHILKKYN